MANETQKEREKKLARREKRQEKAPRLERRNEKTKPIADLQERTSVSADSLLKPKGAMTFGKPKYLACSRGPRNPRKKSEITLYAAKKIT